MGEVYRARDDRLERDIAIKVLPAHSLGDDGGQRPFEGATPFELSSAILAGAPRQLPPHVPDLLRRIVAAALTRILPGDMRTLVRSRPRSRARLTPAQGSASRARATTACGARRSLLLP